MPSGPGTYGSKKGRPPMKKKKGVKAMGGGYMSATGNSAMAKKKKEDMEKNGKRMKAKGGGYMHKSKKKK